MYDNYRGVGAACGLLRFARNDGVDAACGLLRFARNAGVGAACGLSAMSPSGLSPHAHSSRLNEPFGVASLHVIANPEGVW